MTDDKRPPIPVLRRATRDLDRQVSNEVNFRPNSYQERVKAKFYRRLEEMAHVLDLETALANKENMELLAGTDRIHDWLQDQTFANWFLDAEYLADTVSSLQSRAVDVVRRVLLEDEVPAGDRLKAARMLLELGDAFPGRKSEVRFLDDRLNDMSESETDRELAKMKKTMGQLTDGEKETDDS